MAAAPIYAKIFSHSPISHLKSHAALVVTVLELAARFQTASRAGQWAVCDELFEEIERVEREADDLKAQFQRQLPRGVLMPVYRTDLLEIILILDRIPNQIKDYAGISLGRQSTLPTQAGEAFSGYIELGLECVKLLKQLIDELEDLFRSGFNEREIKFVSSLAEKISAIEHRADKERVALNRILRRCEAETPPLDMMFIYQMVGYIAGVTDNCQEAGFRVVAMITR